MTKIRIDQLLTDNNLAESPQKAKSLIIAGKVLVNGQKVDKPGTKVPADGEIRILGNDIPFVSRGGLKLAGALEIFKVDPAGLTILDIGASTGGFSDCLLQKGAARVIALDVGYNQLAWKLRNDPRVTVIEKCNFRYMTTEKFQDLTGLTLVALAVIDVSFISLDKILPPLFQILSKGGKVIALIKPQFEASRDQVEKGGLVKNPVVHSTVIDKIKKVALTIGYEILGETVSPLTGNDGNKEFFILLRKPHA